MTEERPGANADYSINPWMQNRPIQVKKQAYYGNNDQFSYLTLVDQMTMPADAIRAIRPTVGNPPFPPREGYEQRALTIMDVLNIGPTTLMHDTATRQESGQPGSSINSQGQW